MARPKLEPNEQLRDKCEWLIEKGAYTDLADIAQDFDKILHDMGHIKDLDEHFTKQDLSDVIAGRNKLSEVYEYRLAEMLGEDTDQLGF